MRCSKQKTSVPDVNASTYHLHMELNMKRTLRLGAIVVLGGCLFAGALALMQGQRVRVQSEGGRYAAVRINTGNSVRIVQRLSDSPCRLNYSWGYDSNRIWVDNGCRAIFEVNSNGRWDDWNRDDRWGRNDRRNDPWDDRWGRRDDSWNNDRFGGQHDPYCNEPCCNDRYDRNRGDGWWGGGSNVRRVRVQSDNGRRAVVRINNRGVRLVRQLSYARCIEGRTWDSNSSAIWVTDGCRADFQVLVR